MDKIKIQKYANNIHLGILLNLHKTQNCVRINDILNPSIIPKIGYIVLYNNIYATIGFLRKVEGGFGMFDTFVTNANLPSEVRHVCLENLTQTLIKRAKKLKLKGIISLTTDKGILYRANSIGFKETNQTVISLSLL